MLVSITKAVCEWLFAAGSRSLAGASRACGRKSAFPLLASLLIAVYIRRAFTRMLARPPIRRSRMTRHARLSATRDGRSKEGFHAGRNLSIRDAGSRRHDVSAGALGPRGFLRPRCRGLLHHARIVILLEQPGHECAFRHRP